MNKALKLLTQMSVSGSCNLLPDSCGYFVQNKQMGTWCKILEAHCLTGRWFKQTAAKRMIGMLITGERNAQS